MDDVLCVLAWDIMAVYAEGYIMRTGWIYLLIGCLSVSHVYAGGSSWGTTAPFCQILDNSPDPACSATLGYTQASRFSGYGKTRIAEFEGSSELGYYRDVLLGDIDVRLDVDGMLFLGSADIQLPNQLLALAADVGWTWRYVNGSALQVRVAPGVYSDIEGLSLGSLAMPISAAGVMTFNSEVSATVGMQLRPGFDQIFMPIIGVVWGPADWIRVEATLPEARVIGYWNSEWSGHLAWAWENTTYSIREKGDYDRKKITLESYRTTVGVTRTLPGELSVIGEVGMLSNRSVVFKRAAGSMPRDIDIENALFVRFGLGGSF